jgi:hypothetical protein
MRTVDYSDVLRGSAALAGLQVSDLSPAEFALFRAAHDRRLQVAWECHRWPELCRFEQRSFRAPWDAGHAYAAGDEVLDIHTLSYLQALQASTGQPPTIANVVNGSYWAVCQAQYQAEDYVAGTNYPAGAVVRNPADNQFYQVIGATIALSYTNGVIFTHQLMTPTGIQNGAMSYALINDAGAVANIFWGGAYWVLQVLDPVTHIPAVAATCNIGGPVPADVPVAGWTDGGTLGAVASVTAPPSVNWGRLTPFNRYVGYEQFLADGTPLTPIGEFLWAGDRDPRMTTKLSSLPYTLSADGAQFMTLRHTLAYVWLLVRVRRPLLAGDAWVAPAVYASGQPMYFTSALGVGNFYTCAVVNGTTTGGPAPADWAVVEIPYIFRQYLIQGGYADWLTADGQTDKAAAMEGVAQQLLEMEADKLQRQQGQVNRLQWQG